MRNRCDEKNACIYLRQGNIKTNQKKEGNLEGEGAEYVDRKEKKKLTSVRTIRGQRLIANSRLLTGRLILASVVESEQQRSCSP
jgi:hypothetical protein